MSDGEVFRLTTENRNRVADLLEGLDTEDWRAESLCAGWTVADLAGHLLQPMLVGFGRFFLTAVR